MSEFSTAGRVLLTAAGSALLMGAAGAPAFADNLDARHLSVNQGADCAVRDLGLTGEHVLRTGALPKAFNGVHAGGGTDGVRALCHAVDPQSRPQSHPQAVRPHSHPVERTAPARPHAPAPAPAAARPQGTGDPLGGPLGGLLGGLPLGG